MERKYRIAIAQINSTVGDLAGNVDKIIDYIGRARSRGADIVSFPELAITGYPPEDLLLKTKFVDDNIAAVKKLAKEVGKLVVIAGFVDRQKKLLYNAASIMYDGRIRSIVHKIYLPNYGVFDERRYFNPGSRPIVYSIGDLIFGVNICEDIWQKNGPTRAQARTGASLIINISASPYYAGKTTQREKIVMDHARKDGIWISYANLVGGQDEIVFDGQSMIVDRHGKIAAKAKEFREDLLAYDIEVEANRKKGHANSTVIADFCQGPARRPLETEPVPPINITSEIYGALSLGLGDYVIKNGFKKVVIGLSGGIDSSLVAVLAADTLGRGNVTGVFMPTQYTSKESKDDATALAKNLGIRIITIPIERIFELYNESLKSQFNDMPRDTTEENIQARIRGNILMAFSNKFGWLVLTTGNKSEMSTGYATLYGDMAGGFAVIKDVPKTLVYELAEYRNSADKVIPQSIMEKEPTAELKHDQKDSDTLPPYNILDRILKLYIEEDRAADEIVKAGYEKDVALRIIGMVDSSEYKRRQAPPGIKITPKAFGKDRRMPITNRYR